MGTTTKKLLMTNSLESIHPLSDFIQEQAFGGLIRQWLMMGEVARIDSIKAFLENDARTHIKPMETQLLQIAAAYPNHAVRAELIWLYGIFVAENSKLHPLTPGILHEPNLALEPGFVSDNLVGHEGERRGNRNIHEHFQFVVPEPALLRVSV